MTFYSYVFFSADEIIVKMHGSQLTQRYLEKHGFEVPIMVPKLDDLGLRLPPPTFSVMDVERYVGGPLPTFSRHVLLLLPLH